MAPKTFRLTPDNTFAAVIVRNDDSKLFSRLGHDHVIRADRFDAEVQIDPDAPEDLNFTLLFPVDALIVDADQDRPRASLSGTVSSKDQKATADNMLAKGQLHAKKHREIIFQVFRASIQDEEWILDASFTIKGKTHRFSFPVGLQIDEDLSLHGKVELTHHDLGLKPYKAPMGALQNREELEFLVHIDTSST